MIPFKRFQPLYKQNFAFCAGDTVKVMQGKEELYSHTSVKTETVRIRIDSKPA